MEDIKLNGQSMDIVCENIQKLKALFPEVFLENKIDFGKLQAILGNYIENSNESYRFTWSGKSNAFRLSQTPSTGTLRPSLKYPDGTDDSKNFDTTQNLYIEGDNLEVLKLLQKSYNNRIKMIYIDPPYNKDKDFVYPDKWSDPIANYKKITGQIDEEGNVTTSDIETGGGRHTKWLNMMYPRLKLAGNLLADDGVICIQIDDDEYENLKKISNDIFGEENFVGTICVKMSHLSGMKMSHKDKKIPKIKEFILIYSKNKEQFRINPVYIPGKWKDVFDRYNKYVEKKSDRVEEWLVINLSDKLKELNISNESEIENFCMKNAENIFRTAVNDSLNTPQDGVFREIITKTGMIKYSFNAEEVLFARAKLKEFEGKLVPAETIGDIWTDIGINNLHKEGDINFPNGKKPIKLLQRLIHMFTFQQDIILDFFAGSGSTAHAILEQNISDKQGRKFILVQLPENLEALYEKADSNSKKDIKILIDFLANTHKPLYLTEIGKERIRRAGEKIKEELKKKFEEYTNNPRENEQAPMNPDDLDIGFKVFKLDNSNIKKWDVDVGEDFYKLDKKDQNIILMEKLGVEIDNFVEGRNHLDVVYEIMLKYGLDLTYPIETYDISGKKVYSIAMGAVIVCLEDKIDEGLANDIVDLINKLEPNMVRVVIRDLSFVSDDVKTNFKETLRNGVNSYFAKCNNKENQFTFVTI
jgi:adenine-specific DNA-methyltransferase